MTNISPIGQHPVQVNRSNDVSHTHLSLKNPLVLFLLFVVTLVALVSELATSGEPSILAQSFLRRDSGLVPTPLNQSQIAAQQLYLSRLAPQDAPYQFTHGHLRRVTPDDTYQEIAGCVAPDLYNDVIPRDNTATVFPVLIAALGPIPPDKLPKYNGQPLKTQPEFENLCSDRRGDQSYAALSTVLNYFKYNPASPLSGNSTEYSAFENAIGQVNSDRAISILIKAYGLAQSTTPSSSPTFFATYPPTKQSLVPSTSPSTSPTFQPTYNLNTPPPTKSLQERNIEDLKKNVTELIEKLINETNKRIENEEKNANDFQNFKNETRLYDEKLEKKVEAVKDELTTQINFETEARIYGDVTTYNYTQGLENETKQNITNLMRELHVFIDETRANNTIIREVLRAMLDTEYARLSNLNNDITQKEVDAFNVARQTIFPGRYPILVVGESNSESTGLVSTHLLDGPKVEIFRPTYKAVDKTSKTLSEIESDIKQKADSWATGVGIAVLGIVGIALAAKKFADFLEEKAQNNERKSILNPIKVPGRNPKAGSLCLPDSIYPDDTNIHDSRRRTDNPSWSDPGLAYMADKYKQFSKTRFSIIKSEYNNKLGDMKAIYATDVVATLYPHIPKNLVITTSRAIADSLFDNRKDEFKNAPRAYGHHALSRAEYWARSFAAWVSRGYVHTPSQVEAQALSADTIKSWIIFEALKDYTSHYSDPPQSRIEGLDKLYDSFYSRGEGYQINGELYNSVLNELNAQYPPNEVNNSDNSSINSYEKLSEGDSLNELDRLSVASGQSEKINGSVRSSPLTINEVNSNINSDENLPEGNKLGRNQVVSLEEIKLEENSLASEEVLEQHRHGDDRPVNSNINSDGKSPEGNHQENDVEENSFTPEEGLELNNHGHGDNKPNDLFMNEFDHVDGSDDDL